VTSSQALWFLAGAATALIACELIARLLDLIEADQ
jgi:hypothetical protein